MNLHRRIVAVTIFLCSGLAITGPAHAAKARAPLAYWAFNCFTTCADANFQPESVSQQSASMTSSFEPDNGVNESGTTLNAEPNYEARAALTLRAGAGGINNGRDLTWRVNLTGASNVLVTFASRRSSGGFSGNRFQYSLDGASFVDFGAPFDPSTGDFALIAFDLRHVRGLNDNANAAFRIVFGGGSATDATQFTLVDNLKVNGR